MEGLTYVGFLLAPTVPQGAVNFPLCVVSPLSSVKINDTFKQRGIVPSGFNRLWGKLENAEILELDPLRSRIWLQKEWDIPPHFFLQAEAKRCFEAHIGEHPDSLSVILYAAQNCAAAERPVMQSWKTTTTTKGVKTFTCPMGALRGILDFHEGDISILVWHPCLFFFFGLDISTNQYL